jgi:5-methylcytosine-specific restriction endonuclease McrA
LLGHAVPSADIGEVFERGLDSLVDELERHKFAKCARSGPRRSAAHGRYIPAEIRRAVWERDGGRCSFVSEHGRRCEARTRLEYDHVDPVARGGETSVNGLRLRCRTHNQYEAERTFGSGFMDAKREAARLRAVEAKARKQAAADERARELAAAKARKKMEADEQARELAATKARARAEASARARAAAGDDDETSVIPWLRTLGCTLERARHGAELCAHMGDAPLEDRLKVALRGLSAHLGRRLSPGATGPA